MWPPFRRRKSLHTTSINCYPPRSAGTKRPIVAASLIEAGGATPELCNNLGTVLKAAGQLEPAAASFRDAIRLRGDYGDAHDNLANTLLMLHQVDDAEQEFARAVNSVPPIATCTTTGAGYCACKESWTRPRDVSTPLALRPDSAEAHRNRATLWLLMGDYEQGFAEYEWRWKLNDGPRPTFSERRWQGQPLDGSTILLWAEQGLGDTIQFIRYAPLVKQLGAHACWSECPAALQALGGGPRLRVSMRFVVAQRCPF